MKKELIRRAQLLLGIFFFGKVEAKDLVNWAKDVKDFGITSESIEELAILSPTLREEAIRLFLQSIKEFRPKHFKDKIEISKLYALNISVYYLNKRLKTEDVIQKFLHIYYETECHKMYSPFLEFCIENKLLVDRLHVRKLQKKEKPSIVFEFRKILLDFMADHADINYRVELNRRTTKQLVTTLKDQRSYLSPIAIIFIKDILKKRRDEEE